MAFLSCATDSRNLFLIFACFGKHAQVKQTSHPPVAGGIRLRCGKVYNDVRMIQNVRGSPMILLIKVVDSLFPVVT